MGRPRIGIVADHRVATLGSWADLPCTVLPHSYVAAVESAGGAPIVLPSVRAHVDDAGAAAAQLDGLLLMGGRDLDPSLYGADPHPANDAPHPLRDELELGVARAALDRGLPVLGICRGLQVLNVLYGGDLDQHLGDSVDPTPHRDVIGSFTRHPVTVEPASALGALLGADAIEVASHHHQGAGRIGHGLAVVARAPDGTIEALEDPARPFCLAVLWHPEETLATGGLALFSALVAQAALTRETRTRATPSP